MPVQGEARRYDEQAMFALEIDLIEIAYFESCSEFEEEAGLVEQREGGNKNVASKTDGIRNLTPITCIRGATNDRSLYDWWVAIKANGSRAEERNISIAQLNPDGSVRSRINLKRAWIGRYKRGGWDATSDDTTKEEVDFHYHEGDWDLEV